MSSPLQSGASESSAAAHSAPEKRLALTSLAALGVVFGDIGTSPLYTLKEVFSGSHAVPITHGNVYGILSLVFWALILVVAVKYVIFITRADNQGEGGIMALTALALRVVTSKRKAWLLSTLGIFGAALFYGDGMITPAISVLSAVEGLNVAAPALRHWIIPISLALLIGLFLMQSRGTSKVGGIFGPVMLCWFIVIALLGIKGIWHHPEIMWSLNPAWAVRFLSAQPLLGWLALGAVVLAITGGEALYADMGHFGRLPIKLAWFVIVLPALYLNYLGQGALILTDPASAHSPFYLLVPKPLLYPMLGLATLATIIASQAVISGAFSLTRQAVQLGYAPRMKIVHTSDREIGQVYVPGINWMLMGSVAMLVVGFHSSSALAAAYGIAVTLTMMIDTLLAFVVIQGLWHWGRGKAALFLAIFLSIDIAFFSANSLKILAGGWFPLFIGSLIFMLLTTWKRGRALLNRHTRLNAMPLDDFIRSLQIDPPPRVEGTAIFMTTWSDGIPRALLHNLLHNKVLHRRIVLLTVETADIPHLPDEERLDLQTLTCGFYRLKVRYGFKDNPDIPVALALCAAQGLPIEMMSTSFFLGRETLITHSSVDMPVWRKKLFTLMFRNANSTAVYYNLPPNRVVELGTQVEL